MEIKEGDIVTLTEDAKYDTGQSIPDWVKKDKWIVNSISGDKAVIDKNVSGSNSICSLVNVKYLKKKSTKKKATDTTSKKAKKKETVPKPHHQPLKQGVMKVSSKGVALVAKYEGCRLTAYKCPAGVWTIGYGHTAGVKPGQTISKEKATEMLTSDLKKYGDYVNDCVKRGMIRFSLNQNQFDALTSFTYNCGPGCLQNLVSGNSAKTVADKLLLYNKGGGKVLPGLTRRREEERKLFLS